MSGAPAVPRLRRALARLALLAGAALPVALGGCAETQFAAQASKKLAPPSGPVRGIYKVGDPYQINGVWYYPAEDYTYDETGVASWYGPDFHGKYTANGELYDQNDLTAAHRTLPMPSYVRVTNLDNGRAMVLRVNDRGPYARSRIIDISRRGAQLLGFEGVGTAKVRVQILAEESRQLAAAMRAQGGVMVAAARAGAPPLQPPPAAAPRQAVTSAPLAPPPTAMPPAAPPPIGPPPMVAAAPPAVVPVAAVPDPTGQVAQVPPQRTSLYVQAGAFANADNAERLSVQLRAFGRTAITPVMVGGRQFFRVRVGPLATVEDGDRTLDQVINAGHPEARLIAD